MQRSITLFKEFSAIRDLAVTFVLLATTSVKAENLLSCLDSAWERDPILQSAVQAHKSSVTRIPQAKASLLPAINLNSQNNVSNGNYVYSGSEPTDRPIRSNSLTLQLTQALYRPQLLHALSQTELLAKQALAQLTQAEQDLMIRLLQTYFELQNAKNHQEVVAAQTKLQAQQLLVAERGLHIGTHAQPDVEEARSKYHQTLAQAVEAASQWRIKRQELVRITGEPELKASTQWTPLSDNFSVDAWASQIYERETISWIDRARVDSPAVRAQMAGADAALGEIRKTRAAHMPTIDFSASYAYSQSNGNASSAQNFDSSSRVTQYGIQITIPIYAGGGHSAKSREALAAWDKAQFDLDAAQQQAESSLVNAFESIEAAKAQIHALKFAIDAAQSAILGNLTGVRVGKRTLLHVLDSELQLATAQRDWRKARYELILQVAKVKASLGLLEREDFMRLNSGFQAPAIAPVTLQ